MAYEQKILKMRDDEEVYLYKWEPKEGIKTKGIVQIAHGMAEHGSRYFRFAEALNKDGFIVYANDHRGHGKSAEDLSALGYISDKDGFHTMVYDLKEINEFIAKEHGNMPIFLFSHSMGSFLSQRYIQLFGDSIKGVVLSGTGGKKGKILNIAIMLSGVIMKLKGRRAKGDLIDRLTFGSYNKGIKDVKTKFDWLSRDDEEVDKYLADSYCGSVFPASFFYDFYIGLKTIYRQNNINKVPKNLPIFILSGDADPVGEYGKGVLRLVDMYRQLEIKDLCYKLYKGGRHEMLNEINREEVIEDIKLWLNSKL